MSPSGGEPVYGTGKVITRQQHSIDARAVGQAILPQLPAISQEDLDHGELPGDPRPRFNSDLVQGRVARVDRSAPPHHDSSIERRQAQARGLLEMRRGRPVVLAGGSTLVPGLLADGAGSSSSGGGSGSGEGGQHGRFGPSDLAAALPPDHAFTVLCSGAANRFPEFDASKNVWGSCYHVREPEVQQLAMRAVEFAECAAAWKGRHVLLQAHILQRSSGSSSSSSNAAASSLPPFLGCNPTAAIAGSPLEAQLSTGINWGWLGSLLQRQGFGGLAGVRLQCGGSANGLLPMRYSCDHRLLVQLHGRRRVLLLPPTAALAPSSADADLVSSFYNSSGGIPGDNSSSGGIAGNNSSSGGSMGMGMGGGAYPFPIHHAYDGQSMVDWESPDHEFEWPGSSRALSDGGAAVAVLRPGDALYVPAFWFAHQQFLGPHGDTALELTLRPGPRRALCRGGEVLRASRLAEELAVHRVGLAAARQWLLRIAGGAELDVLDLGTVDGYLTLRMAEDVREEVEEGLGLEGPAAAAFLRAVCERRLLPTPWLNQSLREPLYLTDKPVARPDTRTAEERAFPRLFRRKLEAEGWTVPEQAGEEGSGKGGSSAILGLGTPAL